MNFLISRNQQRFGPYPLNSLEQMIQKGNVVGQDLISLDEGRGWQPVADFLASRKATTPSVPPPLNTAPVPASTTPPVIDSPPPIADPALAELERAVEAGGRFVFFQYCVSALVITFKRPSGLTFLRANEDGFSSALGYSLISLVAGWWGVPWGPIWTISTVITNARGGRDVTLEVLQEKLGPERAAVVVKRRRPPGPPGIGMKCFRWGLILLAAAVVGGFGWLIYAAGR